MTRKTRRKVSINGKRSQETVSARMRRRSVADGGRMPGAMGGLRRSEDSMRMGRMNSSEMMVKRKMQPKTATILEMSEVQSRFGVRGYSSS
ncbi:hypothetical protein HYQ44_018137 [Verticillium longisporum]|nr:hypothetical protein HYQ44_018137 [Verticillium longisporum]